MTEWKPEIGDMYYIPEIIDGKPNVFASEWGNDAVDNKRYEAGIVFQNMADAVNMSRTMLSMAACVSSEKALLDYIHTEAEAMAQASNKSDKTEKLAGFLGIAPYQMLRIKDALDRYLFYLSESGLCMLDVVENAIDNTVGMNHLLADLLLGRNEIVATSYWKVLEQQKYEGSKGNEQREL